MPTLDDRAVSAVVGFILVFGLVVAAFTLYQGLVVPDQNRAVEFDHNQVVQRQFLELRTALLSAAGRATTEPVTIPLGTDYPHRNYARNPGRATGSVSTGPPANASIRNVSALDRETRDYLGATGPRLGPFPSRPITYRPTYTYYTDPPTTRVANTVAYNRFPSGATVTLSDQTVIEGRQLTVVTVTGDLTATGAAAVALTPTPLSAPMTRVPVTNRTGPLTIVLPTALTAAEWRSLLGDELDPNGTVAGSYVTDVDAAGAGAVAITLEGNVTYELRLARIGVGRTDSPPPARYLTDVHGYDAAVPENAPHRLTVEVRDRYNNPVSGVPSARRSSTARAASPPRPRSNPMPTAGRASPTGRRLPSPPPKR